MLLFLWNPGKVTLSTTPKFKQKLVFVARFSLNQPSRISRCFSSRALPTWISLYLVSEKQVLGCSILPTEVTSPSFVVR